MTDQNSTTILRNENDLKVFTSPGYPNNFPHNTYIEFTVHSAERSYVKLDFLDLHIETFSFCNNPIRIYDGKLQSSVSRFNMKNLPESYHISDIGITH